MIEEKHRSPVQSLAALFSFILVVVIAGMGLVLYIALQKLPPYAQEVNQNLKQANLIDGAPGGAVSQSKLIARADMFFTTPDTFGAQAEKDIRAYASATGVSISNISLVASGADPSKQTATVKTSGTASFESVVKFIQALEKNVPRITIEALTLQQSAPTAEDSVIIESLTISMQVK